MNKTNASKTRQSRKFLIIVLALCVSCFGCRKHSEKSDQEHGEIARAMRKPSYEFGFKLDDYVFKRDTVRRGDSFGKILERNHLGYPKIFNITQKTKDSFNVRSLRVGKPYTLLCAKDSLETPQHFIYQPNLESYVVVNFKDSIHAYTSQKPIKYVEKTVSGVITSSLSETMAQKGLSPNLTIQVADIYAWTLDFYKLQKGDRFKIIYLDKYIDDSIYAGVEKVKAAYFKHRNTPFYAFEFVEDTAKGVVDYFNETGKNLRRAFLKSPIKFQYRISSRYNLRRRIALYGNRIRPHKGTDFAAPVGTPIMATATGKVSKASYTRGNGNYVKIKHNNVYSTQYLHMKKRKVRVGDFVKQGDVIGWVGMTGNTSGPHVCYRFWKHGKQVDPFKQKLPETEPLPKAVRLKYLNYIKPLKYKLDTLPFDIETPMEQDLERPVISQKNS